jgi:hypothetical protein
MSIPDDALALFWCHRGLDAEHFSLVRKVIGGSMLFDLTSGPPGEGGIEKRVVLRLRMSPDALCYLVQTFGSQQVLPTPTKEPGFDRFPNCIDFTADAYRQGLRLHHQRAITVLAPEVQTPPTRPCQILFESMNRHEY